MTGTIAVLNNVTKMAELCSTLVDRKPGMPAFGVFSGESGRGKSMAATYCLNKFDGFYVECDSTMTQRDFLQAAMREFGIIGIHTKFTGRIHEGVLLIGEFLADHPRSPWFIDESDFLVGRKKIEVVRDIYKKCADAGTSIILIGEENLPNALRQWERVYSRVLKFGVADPLSLDDIENLRKLICPELVFSDDAIEAVSLRIKGSARRTATLFENAHMKATIEGVSTASVKFVNSVEIEG